MPQKWYGMDHDGGHLGREKKIGVFVAVVVVVFYFSLSVMLTFTSSDLIVFSSTFFRLLPVKQGNTKYILCGWMSCKKPHGSGSE